MPLDFFEKGTDITSEVFRQKLNEVAQMAMTAYNLKAGAGLYAQRSPMGLSIALANSIEPVVVKLTSNATGGGKYNGRILINSTNTDATALLNLPEGLQLPDQDDCIILNPAENGTNTHYLVANTYYMGLMIGTLNDGSTGGKRVVLLSNYQLPIPQYQYMILQAVSQNQLGFDFARAHPII